jgi:hypothetical protein
MYTLAEATTYPARFTALFWLVSRPLSLLDMEGGAYWPPPFLKGQIVKKNFCFFKKESQKDERV